MSKQPSGTRMANLPPTFPWAAEEISGGKFAAGERRPDLLGRARDVSDVDGFRYEFGLAHFRVSPYAAPSAIAIARSRAPHSLSGLVNSDARPVSSRLFRLARINGHPLLTASCTLLPGSNWSWVTVSLTSLPMGSSSNVTRDGFSRRKTSWYSTCQL